MKWLAMIGTREATAEMRQDIDERVRQAVADGWGIVSGGSTGVDTVAMIAAMRCSGVTRVYLPIEYTAYAKSLRERAAQGKCLPVDAEATIAALDELRSHDPAAVIDPSDMTTLTPEAFYARN